ncbi:Trk system potassium transporter TrkA [bacterium endosymbiont of Pedicinus badii]|uniref:Trk system potassium transporter TrkA n=1 Tax=bacterium endosymbiont of Pedicinus badii TaxID=1719126 RepID=UPI0009BAE2EB|nr:Trk system potassium transporter TrkA [bacterium endosymbiont of Pedicinus badii]OQM34124.1 hypothetical protein AOQ89_02155 [bacterium endosymbiont of Pedicinus badii]
MKIIIVGAGKIGKILIENLVRKNHDITIIDVDKNQIRSIQNKFDLKTINGFGSHPKILRSAQAQECDILIATTNSDEINIIICQISSILFKIPTCIAKIKSNKYIQESKNLFRKKSIPIDFLIIPKKILSKSIYKIIKYPGLLRVVEFAKKKISFVSVDICKKSIFLGKRIKELYQYFSINFFLFAILRKNRIFYPKEETKIYLKDEIFCILDTKNLKKFVKQIKNRVYKRIMIFGGNSIGIELIKYLKNNYIIKLIEKNFKRADNLAKKLQNVTILFGKYSDRNLMKEENIKQVDLFISITKNDEENIISAILAKKMGAKSNLAMITKVSYINIIKEIDKIDYFFSKKLEIFSSFLKYKYKKQYSINNLTLLQYKNDKKVIEIIVKKNKNFSKMIGIKINTIKFSTNFFIIAIVKKEKVYIYRESIEILIEDGDRIIFFLEKEEELFSMIKNL